MNREKLRSGLPEDQAVYQNLLFKKKEEDFNCVDEYGIDDTLEIKEEIIDDPETAIRKCTEKYEPRLCVYIRNDIFPINELPIRKEKNIQESQLELDRKEIKSIWDKTRIIPSREYQYPKNRFRTILENQQNLLSQKKETDLTNCTVIEYSSDETLEIKEEIIDDHDITDQKYNKKDDSQLFTVGIEKPYNSVLENTLPWQRRDKRQESEQE
ncbi:uncharacterized protein LOC117182846 [Belonocnema kinseyi]|uniref:uncharacterized protein LOC117182846 n=1 Tax=Belonocnema kinseyi TaxID=2817044 RepID=UPI00143D9E35|nr:uncharacterized protein LOC117182846 [Belonocnema kinseyi]